MDREIIDANPSTLKAFGVGSIEKLRGKRDSEVLSPEKAAKRLEEMREMKAAGGPVTREVHFDANDRDYLMTSVPLGKDQLLSTSIDITDRKMAEEALKESEAKYRGLFDSMQDGVSLRRLVFDDRGEVVEAVLMDANPAALKVYAASSVDELKGKMYDEMASPGMKARALDVVKRMRAMGGPITEEEHSDINDRDYMVTAAPLGNDLVITTSVDITEVKRAEEELRNEKNRLQFILDSLPVAVSVADADGRTILRNKILNFYMGNVPFSQGICDYSRFIGHRDGEDAPLAPEEWPLARSLLKGESINNEELDVQGADGVRRTMLASSMPITDDMGKITGGIAVFTDISCQKELERKLKRSNSDLQQFAYVASHDMKEPLRMVTSYLDLLQKRTELDDRSMEFLHFAVDGATRMKAMIDDLLAYSRVETGGRPFAPVDMNEVLVTVVNDLKNGIEKTETSVTFDPLPSISADRTQMVLLMEKLGRQLDQISQRGGPSRPYLRSYSW